ncbi:hypothetical protein OGAPHI_001351 [Ogataea philodendri]|uniref:Zn(2)-C6 fungal-type domain-containing protein n=1 Tax=Ogataea philodendri TaxID=1378263 RepID=A0A9P8T8I3_9ASCO|nr:uncharacterized protein OGAPHI_001351 [Ogataea philodendri]KAH3669230.1 hypothetical protein OGAPHI_001351 [Ogataea philodendri]
MSLATNKVSGVGDSAARSKSQRSRPAVMRARTGCLTCRRKRRKCDEGKHIDANGETKCDHCSSSGLDCKWPSFINMSGKSLRSRTSEKRGEKAPSANAPRSEPSTEFPVLLPVSNKSVFEPTSPEVSSKNQWPLSPPSSLNDDEKSLNGSSRSKKASPLDSLLTPTVSGSSKCGDQVQTNVPSAVPEAGQLKMVDKPTPMSRSNDSGESPSPPDFGSFMGLYSDLFTTEPFAQDLQVSHENNCLDLSHILREYMYVNAFTANSKLDRPPEINHPPKEVLTEYFVSVEKFSVKDFSQPVDLKPEQEISLLRHYVETVGAGLDMFDTHKTMSRIIPQKMQTKQALRYAVLALTSKWLDSKISNYPKGLTKSLYYESLKHLVPTYNDASNDIYIIITCVILCVFEMMNSNPPNWKQYLEGCVLLFRSYNITGLATNEIDRATFWVFIRMDVCHSVINESPTLLASEHWVLPYMTADEIEQAFNTPEMHANYIVYLSSLVVNLIYGEQEADQFKSKWLDLWVRLKRWEAAYEELFGRTYEVYDAKVSFPRIFFANTQAISSNQMYHMSCILMLQNKPHSLRLSALSSADSSLYPSVSLLHHAKRIIGIAITNSDYGAHCNSIQPLFVAGLILTSRQEYGILLNALRTVESSTGWSTQWRMTDLMKFWSKGD